VEVGVREGDELELYFPDGFGTTHDPADTSPRSGVETLKLFASTKEVDFSMLAQEGYRSLGSYRGEGTDSPLGQLLDMALTGQGTRNIRRNKRPPEEEWTTENRTFVLRARAL
jgi:hypothetical protein